MRKLVEITDDVRRSLPVDEDELRYALCAYDVLLANLNLDKQPDLMAEFFRAAESDPKVYIGWENDPTNPGVVAWHQAMINVEKHVSADATDDVATVCGNCGPTTIEDGDCVFCGLPL